MYLSASSFITHRVKENAYSFRLKIGNIDKTLKGCTWKGMFSLRSLSGFIYNFIVICLSRVSCIKQIQKLLNNGVTIVKK